LSSLLFCYLFSQRLLGRREPPDQSKKTNISADATPGPGAARVWCSRGCAGFDVVSQWPEPSLDSTSSAVPLPTRWSSRRRIHACYHRHGETIQGHTKKCLLPAPRQA
jgi:hypothetical protein